jgi:hypothetical protein
MKRFLYPRYVAATLLALIALCLSAGCSSVENARAQEELERPTVVPATVLTPAPTPPDSREVAILTLYIRADEEGAVEAVELESASIVRSFAPNVLGLYGAWTVELVGKDTIRFGALNPLHVRVYGDEEAVPHTDLWLTETTWRLVVPLYDRGEDLEVTEINIYDETQEWVFSTPVDREVWSGE